MKKQWLIIILLIIPILLKPSLKTTSEKENSLGIEVDSSLRNIVEKTVDQFLKGCFTENLGQVNNQEIILFGRIPGGLIGFARGKVLFSIGSKLECLTLSFNNANPVIPIGIGQEECSSNYFFTSQSTCLDLCVYDSILYQNLWEGIDLIYHATEQGAKYEFIVFPGANPRDIQLHLSNQEEIMLEAHSLMVSQEESLLIDEGLVAFQEDGSEVTISYIKLDSQTIAFDVKQYDSSKMLIIDPLIYSTYVGGNNLDYVTDMKVDSQGCVYVTGQTASEDFPIANAFDDTLNGTDIFVFKLNATGNGLIWSTFIGGNKTDYSCGLALDSLGQVYVAGYTESDDFPTFNAMNDTNNGMKDIVAFKLNSTGNGLIYSTYIGGIDEDGGRAITIDSNGNMYIAGSTYSSDFPTVNPFNATLWGSSDGFVLKLNSTGTCLLYSTFIGGSFHDGVDSIGIDSEGNVYATGQTGSMDFPMVNAYNSINKNGDIFVFKLNATGNDLIYSTFVGGSSEDFADALTVDSEGNAYVTGFTWSADFPTKNAYSNTLKGSTDCFVFKLNSFGNNLVYSTYLGGGSGEQAFDIELDENDNAYVTSATGSGDLPIVYSLDDSLSGLTDYFLYVLNESGNELIYSTYIGGSKDEGEEKAIIELGSHGTIYLSLSTNSDDFPTFNAYDSTYNHLPDEYFDDCVVLKFLPDIDSDYDGLTDEDEVNEYGTDPNNNDTDGDGILDGDEVNIYNTDPLLTDSDEDDLTDFFEVFVSFTNPNNNDTDSDEMPDGWEIEFGLNATQDDASDDLDNDSLCNLGEYQNGTLPDNQDTDADWMSDGFEILYGLNPLSDDSNADPDNDELTNREEFWYGTYPNNNDTDSDQIPDGWEISNNLNATLDDSDEDPDSDDLTNLEEYLNDTNPHDADSDSDGLNDNVEVNTHSTNPLSDDTDNDLMPDAWEVQNNLNPLLDDALEDNDDDELLNIFEFVAGTHANDNDTDSDLMPDGWEVFNNLNPLTDDSAGDPDEDGFINLIEFQNGTDPWVSDAVVVLDLITENAHVIAIVVGVFIIGLILGWVKGGKR